MSVRRTRIYRGLDSISDDSQKITYGSSFPKIGLNTIKDTNISREGNNLSPSNMDMVHEGELQRFIGINTDIGECGVNERVKLINRCRNLLTNSNNRYHSYWRGR